MAEHVIVRFTERQSYDINWDCQVVRFMATTPAGSYYADVLDEGARSVRELRQRFKDRAVNCIQEGLDPCEIDLGEYDA